MMQGHRLRGLALIVVGMALLGGGWTGMTVAQESLPVPDVSATSVFAFDPSTGEVIMAWQADERVAIGSITKIVTAMVAIDILPSDQTVVVEGGDMVAPGYSAMGLQPGDTLTVEQLLTGVVVVSGGDAANALARTAGGVLCACDDPEQALSAFVAAMNQLAVTLGLENTQFANVDGADSPAAWSSARDVAYLYQAFTGYPVLEAMAAMPSYAFVSVGAEQTPYEGLSTNQLVGQYNLTSAKTGSETNAGGCIVLARTATDGVTTEIIALLGADLEYDELWNPVVDARWDDTATVIDAIDTGWTPGQFVAAPEVETDEEPAAAGIPAFDPEAAERADPVPVHNDGPDVMQSANADIGTMAPVAVLSAVVGVLGLTAVVSWVRPGETR